MNAAYLRRCWEEIRFDDVPYSEDQAFGKAMLAAGWTKVFHPGAAVQHAHDYGPVGFMRRYFDEYRGLRETTGHVERLGVRSTARDVRSLVAADRRWMREQGFAPAGRSAWTARSVVHHGGRKAFAALGSRADRLPSGLQRAISLEGRALGDGSAGGPPPREAIPALGPTSFEALLEVARDGELPLCDPVAGMAERERLHIAVVIPPFRRGSGGHSTIYNLLTRLEERGHTVSTWLHDPIGLLGHERAAVVRGNLREFFRPIAGPVFKGFDDWYGADVALATGWDTVFPVLRLPLTRARAYLVQDHEPEFSATSAQSLWARESYLHGLHVIAASPWLAELAEQRYGATATTFDLGVEHAVYKPRAVPRRDDTVIFYARDVTPRRAVPLGLLALEELRRRRPGVRFMLFGDDQPIRAPFPYEHLGIASPEQLSWAYSEATVGLSLSLTNYSLIPQEMLACGLPVVELGGLSLEGVFGADGPVELAAPDPMAIADALERLLLDAGLRERRAREGLAFVAGRTWDRAAAQLERGLREALRSSGERSPAPDPVLPPAADPAAWQAGARSVPVAGASGTAATDRLHGRLDAGDLDAIDAALDGGQRATLASASPDDARRIALAFGVWHRVPAVLEKTGLQPGRASARRARDGPRPAGGRRRAVLRRPGRRDARARRRDAGRRPCADWTSAAPRDAWCARWRPPGRRPSGTGATPTTEAIGWAREHLPGVRFLHAPAGPAAALRRRRDGPGGRDLDLVALRRGGRDRLAGRAASRRAPRRPAAADDARPAGDRPRRARRRALGRAARAHPPRALPPATGSRAEFGPGGDWGVRTRSGAPRSSRPSGSRATPPRRGRSSPTRSAATPATRTCTCCAAAEARWSPPTARRS